MGRPTRPQHEIENVREDILHSAGRAFSRQGFDSVTIHDIAKEAGYTATSLYAYFKGKQEIIDALVAAVKHQFKSAFDAEVPPGLAFPQRLGFLFERFAELSERWPEARLIMLEYKRSDNARFQPQQRRAARQGMDASMVSWLKRNAAGPKELAGRRPEEIAHVIRSLVLGAFLAGDCGLAQESSPRDRLALALQVCLYGLCGSVPPAPPPQG
jgi:AcrR family transcriptional regulator